MRRNFKKEGEDIREQEKFKLLDSIPVERGIQLISNFFFLFASTFILVIKKSRKKLTERDLASLPDTAFLTTLSFYL